ncbi:MAG TPA: hypothetical protein PLA94_03755 [Myxococcota bacterium]|nr:hypothetical protein [Myxococcota bacterium]HND29083.1 hypothetical protein [Myxococcota bacterium]
MRWLIAAIPCVLGAWSLVPRIDQSRHERNIDAALLFPPNGEQIRLGATGLEEPLADLLWVRTVLMFGERYDTASGSQWTLWLQRMILAVTTLDPHWRTPYFYGGVMLRVASDIDSSDRVFEEGVKNLPDDYFFPFSLGMNAFLYRNDQARAAEWLKHAAKVPGAPTWYAAAAAAMKVEAGGRKAAQIYLQSVLDSTTDPGIRADTEWQLSRLAHDDLVETWAEACTRYRAEHDAPLASPKDLEKLGFSLPENPRKDKWVVGRDGVVRSEGAEKEHWADALRMEMKLIGR